MSPRQHPTLHLDDVAADCQNPSIDSYHVYGIFKQTEIRSRITFWTLLDETLIGGLDFKLAGSLEDYPDPKSGDIVRIHRVFTDKRYNQPVVLKGHNVVIWRAHKYDPPPITKAQNPTLSQSDNDRRRTLERLYCTLFTKLSSINASPDTTRYYDVYGRIDDRKFDPYENLLLSISDGTGSIGVRVFPKRRPLESKEHFANAYSAKEGDYVAFTNTKLNKQGSLDLSANEHFGRSLRLVEHQSILGVLLSEALGAADQIGNNGLRRSPRLQALKHNSANTTNSANQNLTGNGNRNGNANGNGIDHHSNRESETDGTILHQEQESSQLTHSQSLPNQPSSIPTNRSPTQPPVQPHKQVPIQIPNQQPNQAQNLTLSRSRSTDDFDLTRLSEVRFCSDNFKRFINIAGQVRGSPVFNSFGHCVFQLFDGSKPLYPSADLHEFPNPLENAVGVVVYRKQRDNDTNEHIEVAQKLRHGDLVRLNNVRAHTRERKLKLDLSANLTNNKSIRIIDKTSELGIRLLEQVNNPHLDELIDRSPNSSQELDDYEGEPPI